jgi:integrase/recombinase XerD
METRKISNTSEEFLTWLQVERRFAQSSIISYRSRLKCFVRDVGDLPLEEFTTEHIFGLKQILYQRENSEVFIGVCLACIKGLLKYCQEELRLEVLDAEKIRRPKIPKRRVDYLTKEELKRFFYSIGKRNMRDFRFRAFVSVLISTGCRISEALNLRIQDIDWEKKEAMIVGKGNKQRKLYFTDWSLKCIREYIKKRGYDGKFIFVAEGKTNRWGRNDAQRNFRNYRMKLGLPATVTAHTIRHSFATLLMKKGVSLGHIQVLLGHSDIQTTSRHYLGILSDDEAKEAHEKGMNMDNWL